MIYTIIQTYAICKDTEDDALLMLMHYRLNLPYFILVDDNTIPRRFSQDTPDSHDSTETALNHAAMKDRAASASIRSRISLNSNACWPS